MTSATLASTSSARVATRRLPLATLIAAAVAVVGNLIVYIIAGSLLGVPLEIQMAGPGSPVVALPIVMLIIASAVPAIPAAILLAILGRFLARPFTVFLAIGVVFLLISLGGPHSLEIGTSTKIALDIMHVVAGASILGVLSSRARDAA